MGREPRKIVSGRGETAGTLKASWFWLAIGAAWLAWGIVNASTVRMEANLDWSTAFRYGLPDALIWFALTPLVLALARRFPIIGAGVWKALLLHLAAAPAMALLHSTIDAALNSALDESNLSLFQPIFTHLVRYTLHQNVLTYFVVSGFAHYAAYSRRALEQEKRTAELEGQLTRARLSGLRAQLRPHFLFNSLNTVSSMMGKDPEEGRKVIARLGKLLRASLDDGDRQLIPLSDELDLVGAYLEIEQARFRDRLRHRIQASPEALQCSVPALLLQPLVENAVHHGLSSRVDGGCVTIEAARDGGKLRIEVRDDGKGLAAASGDTSGATGLGLANIRARLDATYGDKHRFEIRNGAEGGVEVLIEMPAGAAGAAGVGGAAGAGRPS